MGQESVGSESAVNDAPLAAIILAAGASTRMGQPKALLRWRGQSFLRRVIALAEAAGCAPIVAVDGAVELRGCAEVEGARLVHNPTWPEGPLRSLQVGLAALCDGDGRSHREISGVLVLTVDRPRLAEATVRALVAAHRREPPAIWQPAMAGRRGHPILYPRGVLAELRALPAAGGPRGWLRSPAIARRRRSLEVEDPTIFDNFDRPQDLAALADGR